MVYIPFYVSVKYGLLYCFYKENILKYNQIINFGIDDHSRVSLKISPGDNVGYINANFIEVSIDALQLTFK